MNTLSKIFRSTAALCAILTAGSAFAQDGVVRISDRASNSAANGEGFVRVSGTNYPAIHPAGFMSANEACGSQCAAEGCNASGCPAGCPCGSGTCCPGGVCSSSGCNLYFSACDSTGMPACWCQRCGSSPCQCGFRSGSFGDGHRDHVNTLFAGSVDSGTGSCLRDCWRGQSLSFRNKNARLSNHLFGWMVPSGFSGHGAPPVGAYHVTYADQPDYIDPRDTQLYGTQQYGMPIAVPIAPTVNHQYNYSAGVPASRITHIGNYNPQTSPQPLYHQTW